MAKKSSEVRWRDICRENGWFWYKFGDVRYCIHCKKPLPKSELKPDFVTAPVHTYVECKNNSSDGTWRWVELAEDGERSLQREWLNEHGGWLFIELGTGRAPENKGAWLVPWGIWTRDIEPVLIERDQKSLRYRTVYNKDGISTRGNIIGADELLLGYGLEWEAGTGWTIPKGHIWWRILHKSLKATANHIAETYL